MRTGANQSDLRLWLGCGLALLTFSAPAATGETPAPVSARSGLAVIDWVIIAAYAVATLWMGWHYGRKQESTQEYFTGSGKMPPLLIGVSLFATLLSTITYLSIPGEMLGKGPVYLATLIGYPIVFWVVGHVMLPVYMKQRVTSAYELLEARLGLSVRMLGVGMFLALRLVWMSLLVFLTAKAMSVMMGLDEKWIPLIVLITGLVAVVYTSVGGLRAVVITDLLQTILLYGGSVLVIATVTWQFGGFGWFPTQWQAHWDTQPVFSLDPSVRVTLVGSVLSMALWQVCTAGGDQTSIQRFMSTADADAARRAYATQLVVTVVVILTLATAGLALMGYFQLHPGQLPDGTTLKVKADNIFPHYISFHLPPVISGLVVSGMFAAAMSSIDSGINSITAVVMTDFMDRFGRKPKDDQTHFRTARKLAFAIGAVVIVGSSFMGGVPGNITAVTGKTANLLTAPIFCLFFFALFVPFANARGVWLGAVAGITAAVLIAFCDVLLISPELSVNDLKNPPALAARLKEPSDSVSVFIRERLHDSTRRELDAWKPSGSVPLSLQAAIVADLNSTNVTSEIWDEHRFAAVPVQPGIQQLLTNSPSDTVLARAARVLLEDAYPADLLRDPYVRTYADGRSPVSFIWIMPGSLVANLAVGLLACWALRERKSSNPS